MHTQSDTTISLITCYPGSDIYELEGHTAVRIALPDGRDMALNYGLFDFAAPNFVYRFVKGETDYRCGLVPTDLFVSHYASEGRKVVEQTLNLTGAQKARLIELASENLLPENATYRYNYVKDNCATRPLSLIERSVGAPVEFHADSTYTTFRNEMRHFHSSYPWYQFGIDLALGNGIDYPVSVRETAFAPMNLLRLMDKATYTDPATGSEVRLVSSVRELSGGPEQGAALPPTPAWQTPAAAGILTLAVALWATLRQLKGRALLWKWVDTLLFGMQGLAGLLLTFLIFVSVHEATSPNLLYMWLNPAALAGSALVWLKTCKKALLCYHFINFALLALMSLVWCRQAQSGNAAFIPFIAASALRSGCHIYIYFLRGGAPVRQKRTLQ